ncbi:MAG: iron ABC transporter permease [Peptostreptococcaceae bacterium]|nr:iron ABC transporter permease [Peptostreptococcaceae bacterium]
MAEKIRLALILFAVLFAAVLFCTSIGVTDSDIGSVFSVILKLIKGEAITTQTDKVILHLRLPRTILAVLAGFGLAFSGSVMQGIARNPLVSPFTIGVSSAAAFGASLTIVYGIGFFGSSKWGIVLNAFSVAILCAIFIFAIASKVGSNSSSLILTGISMNYLFQAMSTAIQFTANDAKLAQVVAWSFGSLNGAQWDQIKITAIITMVSFIMLLRANHSLTILSIMEDDIAKTMGIDPSRTRAIGSLFSVVTTAAIISFTGIIGFVGLAAPHIARSLAGNDYRIFLPMSGIVGALLVLTADTLGRTLLSPVIIPVGVIISFIGVPIFIHQVIFANQRT